MPVRALLALATFLCLVPVTLLVPGLQELVVTAHGGSEGEAHAFMSVNMLAGILAVPITMRGLARSGGDARRWAQVALLVDGVAFAAMAAAPSLPVLFVARAMDGAAHLPAVTLLMVASNRLAREGRGRMLGAMAAAIMAGVAVGSPLGGWLVTHAGPRATYLAGAGMLLLAAAVTGALGPVRGRPAETRYAWRRDTLAHWVPLGYAFLDRFTIGIFVSTFTLYLANVVGLSAQQRGFMVTLFVLPFALLCYPVGRLADRTGWFVPMLTGNLLFGATFASYGLVPAGALPLVMVVSGVFSALMFAPNLLLVSDLARLGAGEGLFGAFQVAGSLGFLVGPVVGGVLVGVTRGVDGVPAYREIFMGVGVLAFAMAMLCYGACRRLARQLAASRRHTAGLGSPIPDRAT